jgi:hypothetical protein
MGCCYVFIVIMLLLYLHLYAYMHLLYWLALYPLGFLTCLDKPERE